MSAAALGPRLVVAGTHSGVGKTTVATGLLAALRAKSLSVAAAKVGPDFIDPGYHALACERAPRNLDPWLCGPRAMAALAARAGQGADVLVIEGVMGLFDGANDGGPSSTADVAGLLGAPVLLVVDAEAMSASVAALVHGYATFDPSVRVGGVILNRVGSEGHETLLREALEPLGIPVLGALRRDDAFRWRDRHLGLVPVAEQPGQVQAAIDLLAARMASGVDLDAVVALARHAEPVSAGTVPLPEPGRPVDIAVAAGPAFTFTYTDTVEAIEAAGGRVSFFDPLSAPCLPPGTGGLVIGGGFPEIHVAGLAANRPLLDDIARQVGAGLPTWAECGGLMLLTQELDGHPMAGVVPAVARMTDRLTLGYRIATTCVPSPVGPTGTPFRGHEFHYSTVEPAGEALLLDSRWGTKREGWAGADLLATYLHHHPGGDPRLVGAFVRHCALRDALPAR
ncbi:MAG: cobyrinate a,c-diamide synthase [Acidimicrobiales bacterium]|nr:cobyrinate a,c-diamide synthase [Acidimicrobiales bacterium]